MPRLSKLQKKAIRVITCSKFNAHTEPLYKSLNLLKLEDMFSPNVLELYYKLCYGNLSVYVTNLFTRTAPVTTHNYDSRPSDILKHPLSILVLLSDAFDLCYRKLWTIRARESQRKLIRIRFKDLRSIWKWQRSIRILLIVWLLIVTYAKTHNTHINLMGMLVKYNSQRFSVLLWWSRRCCLFFYIVMFFMIHVACLRYLFA